MPAQPDYPPDLGPSLWCRGPRRDDRRSALRQRSCGRSGGRSGELVQRDHIRPRILRCLRLLDRRPLGDAAFCAFGRHGRGLRHLVLFTPRTVARAWRGATERYEERPNRCMHILPLRDPLGDKRRDDFCGSLLRLASRVAGGSPAGKVGAPRRKPGSVGLDEDEKLMRGCGQKSGWKGVRRFPARQEMRAAKIGASPPLNESAESTKRLGRTDSRRLHAPDDCPPTPRAARAGTPR